MADGTRLFPGSGGDLIQTEDMGVPGKIPVTKIRIGALDVDGGDVTNVNPFPAKILDGAASGLGASVGAFHNTDNQTLPAAGGSLLTGGVPQITNPTGTADRARGTGVDGIPAVGITVGAANFAQKLKTTVALAVGAPGSQAVTPASMTGIQFGTIIVYDVGGANQEVLFVTAVTATTFTATFTKTHPINSIVTGFIYNQERDAKGELDGADGTGTAVAAEYEFNGGSPGGGFFDRARSLQGKGVNTTTLNGAVAPGATSVVLTGPTTGLQPGMPLYFNAAGTGASTVKQEAAYVDINYVPGALTVPLQSGLVSAHNNLDSVFWGVYVARGPVLSGFLPEGIGIEEEALYDPVTDQFFIERAATQDAMPVQNIVAENPALFNGTNADRAKGQSSSNTLLMLTPSPLPGVQLVNVPAGWRTNSAPAAATQATTTQAAGAAGVRHVCTSITATLATGATAQTPISVFLRDGATGAGAVIWSAVIAAPVNGNGVIGITGLAIPGSAATAMTLEFSAAGVAASLEAVTLTGYDIT